MTTFKKQINKLKKLAIATSIAFVPMVGFAQTLNTTNTEDHTARSGLATCLRTLSSLTISDIINMNLPSRTTLSQICFGTTATDDTEAPTLSQAVTVPSSNKAIIVWRTNELADSAVFFSNTTPVSTSSNSMSEKNSNFAFNHAIILEDLQPSTTYNFVVRSRDHSGNVKMSDNMTLTTTSGSQTSTTTPTGGTGTTTPPTTGTSTATTTPPTTGTSTATTTPPVTGTSTATTTPPVTGTSTATTTPSILSVTTVKTGSTLQVSIITDVPTLNKVFYSTTTPVDTTSTSSQFAESGFATSSMVSITGVAPDSALNLIVQSRDESGNTVLSNIIPAAVTENETSTSTPTTTGTSTATTTSPTTGTSTVDTSTTTTGTTIPGSDGTSTSTATTTLDTSTSTTATTTPDTTSTSSPITTGGTSTTTETTTDETEDETDTSTTTEDNGEEEDTSTTSASLTFRSIFATVGSESINMTWKTSEPSTSKLFMSTSTSLDMTSPSTTFLEDDTINTHHAIRIADLQPNTIYRFVLQSQNESGIAASSIEFPLVTIPAVQ